MFTIVSNSIVEIDGKEQPNGLMTWLKKVTDQMIWSVDEILADKKLADRGSTLNDVPIRKRKISIELFQER